jgi:hypothetical protein
MKSKKQLQKIIGVVAGLIIVSAIIFITSIVEIKGHTFHQVMCGVMFAAVVFIAMLVGIFASEEDIWFMTLDKLKDERNYHQKAYRVFKDAAKRLEELAFDKSIAKDKKS